MGPDPSQGPHHARRASSHRQLRRARRRAGQAPRRECRDQPHVAQARCRGRPKSLFPLTVTHVLTDIGSCFTADAFEKACRALKVGHRRTKPYTPEDQWHGEAFQWPHREGGAGHAHRHPPVISSACSRPTARLQHPTATDAGKPLAGAGSSGTVQSQTHSGQPDLSTSQSLRRHQSQSRRPGHAPSHKGRVTTRHQPTGWTLRCPAHTACQGITEVSHGVLFDQTGPPGMRNAAVQQVQLYASLCCVSERLKKSKPGVDFWILLMVLFSKRFCRAAPHIKNDGGK